MQAIDKRGETVLRPQSSAAPFLIVLTLILVFYVIFLPPDAREELLSDTGIPSSPTSSNGGSGTGGYSGSGSGSSTSSGGGSLRTDLVEEFVFTGPGPVSERSRDSYEHDISSFNLRGEYEAIQITKGNDFIVQSSLFSGESQGLSFVTRDPNLLRNVVLTFDAPTSEGQLYVSLNGRTIYSSEVRNYNVGPILIQPEWLNADNELSFRVSTPGLAFWKKNTYQISNLKIIGDIIDPTGLISTDIVDVRAVEVQAMQSAKLRFEPVCSGSKIEKLSVRFNGEVIMNKLPDCGVVNVIPIPRNLVTEGQNEIMFESTGGSYLVDQVQMRINLDEDDGFTYYFELSDDYFSTTIEADPVCGEADGYCPYECSEDVDPDCCYDAYTSAYWCDVPTAVTSDRCTGAVTAFNVNRCASGYEDKRGDVAEDYEDTCGDDNDGICPAGCSEDYDEDCCLVEDSNKFWCADLPTGGVSNICKQELTDSECGFCPSGYEGEDSTPSCTYDSRRVKEEEEELKQDYRMLASFLFVDDESLHTAEIIVNGVKTTVDSRDDEIVKDISSMVRDNNNYIQIIPKSDFSLVELRVQVEER